MINLFFNKEVRYPITISLSIKCRGEILIKCPFALTVKTERNEIEIRR